MAGMYQDISGVGENIVVVTGVLTLAASGTGIYAAGDAITDSASVPTIITFSQCARMNGGTGRILSAQLNDSQNNLTLKLSGELFLFNATVTPDNDNAVFTPTDAEMLTVVAVIPFTTWSVGDATSGAGGNAVSFGDLGNFDFACASGDAALYGLLVARNAYTPVNSEVLTFKLRIKQD